MTKLLDLSKQAVENGFGRQAFDFRHHLSGHPLTSLEALEDLAASLPQEEVEHNRGQIPTIVANGDVPRANLTPAEIVRTIETNDCWVVLPVHSAPSYAELLDELFHEVQTLLPNHEGCVRHRQAVFFLASSGSTTPTHIDLEQGFLLHLRGSKTLKVGAFPDALTGQRAVEGFHTGGHRNVASVPHNAATFELASGVGVHIPAFSPHVVHTGPGQVALSLTIALRTDATLRTSAVHRTNARMRRFGLQPQPPGERAVSDKLKSRLVLTADGAARVLRGARHSRRGLVPGASN